MACRRQRPSRYRSLSSAVSSALVGAERRTLGFWTGRHHYAAATVVITGARSLFAGETATRPRNFGPGSWLGPWRCAAIRTRLLRAVSGQNATVPATEQAPKQRPSSSWGRPPRPARSLDRTARVDPCSRSCPSAAITRPKATLPKLPVPPPKCIRRNPRHGTRATGEGSPSPARVSVPSGRRTESNTIGIEDHQA
jgi:hypothetical protein